VEAAAAPRLQGPVDRWRWDAAGRSGLDALERVAPRVL